MTHLTEGRTRLEALPSFDRLLNLFARFHILCEFPNQSDRTNEAVAAVKDAIDEADALCFLELQRRRDHLQPDLRHVRKAHDHMSRSASALMHVVEMWRERDAPEIAKRELARKARSKRRAARIAAARARGEDSDDARADSEQENNNADDSNLSRSHHHHHPMDADPRQMADPRRLRAYAEFASLLPANTPVGERRAVLQTICRNRLKSDIVDSERRKIQDELVQIYTSMKRWYADARTRQTLSQSTLRRRACLRTSLLSFSCLAIVVVLVVVVVAFIRFA